MPSRTFWMPSATTRSPGFKFPCTTHSCPTRSPVVTGRMLTLLSSPTTAIKITPLHVRHRRLRHKQRIFLRGQQRPHADKHARRKQPLRIWKFSNDGDRAGLDIHLVVRKPDLSFQRISRTGRQGQFQQRPLIFAVLCAQTFCPRPASPPGSGSAISGPRKNKPGWDQSAPPWSAGRSRGRPDRRPAPAPVRPRRQPAKGFCRN